MEAHAGLNNLDYAVIGIVLFSGLLAFARGLVREVLSLVTWAGAILAALQYYALAEPLVSRYIKDENMVSDVSRGVAFCVVFIFLALIGATISHFVKGRTITAIDRSLGFVFGLVRGALVVSLVYLMVTTAFWPDVDKPKQIQVHVMQPDEAQQAAASDADKEHGKTEDNDPAPAWFMKAKTRPFMALGASRLAAFIPKKDIEKKTQKYLEEKAAAKRMIENSAQDILSTPGITKKVAP